MPDINPSIPVVGQPDSTEEPKVVTALTQLIAAVNDVDTDQIADGTITAADLATVIQEALFSPGDLKITAHAAADSGWLMCDGAAVSRTTYAALFAKISTTYGAGDGTTTFNLPDLRGRVPVGEDGAAGRLAANDALGNAGGEETHTLTVAEMPAHGHGTGNATANGFVVTAHGAVAHDSVAATPDTSGVISSSSVWDTTVASTANAGGGSAHNIMQPYQVVNYQIKT